MRSLAELHKGQSGVIHSINECDAKMKLMEMGCIPGSKVTLLRATAFGGPIAIEIAGYVLSMRLSEARQILLDQN